MTTGNQSGGDPRDTVVGNGIGPDHRVHIPVPGASAIASRIRPLLSDPGGGGGGLFGALAGPGQSTHTAASEKFSSGKK